MDVGDGDSARMMVGGEGAKAENQRNDAFVHVCHVLPTIQSLSVVYFIKEFRNTSTIHSCCHHT